MKVILTRIKEVFSFKSRRKTRRELIRAWAHAPWHAWLKEEPEWMDLFASFLARLPQTAMQSVLGRSRRLIVLPPVEFGRVVRINATLPNGAWILQLDSKLLERPESEALAIIAHEFAHLCVQETDNALTNDLRADHLASSWGFRSELKAALKRDLPEAHPRYQEMSKAA